MEPDSCTSGTDGDTPWTPPDCSTTFVSPAAVSVVEASTGEAVLAEATSTSGAVAEVVVGLVSVITLVGSIFASTATLGDGGDADSGSRGADVLASDTTIVVEASGEEGEGVVVTSD